MDALVWDSGNLDHLRDRNEARRVAGERAVSREEVDALYESMDSLESTLEQTVPEPRSLPPGVSPDAWPISTEAARPYHAGDPAMRTQRADPTLETAAARRTAVSLGRQVHALRKARGLTQRQAGALLGWDQPQWARLEAGRVYPTLATLELLASRLGVRIVLTPDAQGLLIALEALSAAA